MKTALDRLTALVPPPERSGAVDWPHVERWLGHPLPDDYKRLVDTYGLGTFDPFLWIFQPVSGNDNLDMSTQRQRQLDGLRMLQRGGQSMPYPIDGPQPALLPWGITDNGDVGYCLRTPVDEPNGW